MKFFNQLFTIVFFVFFSQISFGQDVEKLIDKARGLKEEIKNTFDDSLKISGGISALSELNYISSIPRRNNLFNYQFNAALNFSIYGLTLPLAFNFSNERVLFNYDLPPIKLPSYSFAGMSPSYKWATLHIGDRSMSFSPYTLSGHSFRGLGTELNPGPFYFAAMYGRLQRAQAEDLTSLQNLDPAYKRMAWGLKMGYDNGTDNIFLILFKGWDDPNSLDLVENRPELAPADNTVFSIQGKKQITKLLSLSVDYALSAFSSDQRMDKSNKNGIFPSLFGLYQPRVNSEYFSAIKTTLGFQVNFGQLNLNHEWVQPGYRTLGALFFNNDFENWTIGTNLNLLDKKLALNTKVGIERNNLNGTEPNTAHRLVGDINATISLNEKFNINASYSNFRNTSKLSSLSQPLILIDSIILSQVNQNANLSVSYLMGEEKNSTLTTTFSYNQANSVENDEVQADQATTNYTASLAHSYVFMASKLTLTSSLFATWNQSTAQQLFSTAPTFSIQKPLLEEKLNATSSFSYVLVYTEGTFSNSIINWQASLDYTLFEKHNLAMTFTLINRTINEALGTDDPAFTEAALRLNYRWNF